jgi:hypothetical protein
MEFRVFLMPKIIYPTLGDLMWTMVEVPDASSIRETFTSDGRISYWHRVDKDGSEEICVDSKLESSICHLVRIHRQIGAPWLVCYAGLITTLPDGSQKEVRLDSNDNAA